jgi:hypothetical protein
LEVQHILNSKRVQVKVVRKHLHTQQQQQPQQPY